MNLNNKLIWTITDGSEGMISQVMGLAQQMSSNILQIKTNLFGDTFIKDEFALLQGLFDFYANSRYVSFSAIFY